MFADPMPARERLALEAQARATKVTADRRYEDSRRAVTAATDVLLRAKARAIQARILIAEAKAKDLTAQETAEHESLSARQAVARSKIALNLASAEKREATSARAEATSALETIYSQRNEIT